MLLDVLSVFGGPFLLLFRYQLKSSILCAAYIFIFTEVLPRHELMATVLKESSLSTCPAECKLGLCLKSHNS